MFSTLRSKLMWSYAAVAALCLLLALVVSLGLARTFSERNTYGSLREKGALVFPYLQLELTDASRPAVRPLLSRIRENMIRSGVRVLLVNASTMRVQDDISLHSTLEGTVFNLTPSEGNLQDLAGSRGIEGRFRDAGVTYLYVARSLRALPTGDASALAVSAATMTLQVRPAGVIVVLAEPQRGLAALTADLFASFGPPSAVALLLSLIAAYALALSISRPVAKLAEGAEAMARGDYSHRVPVEGRDELATLSSRFNAMAEDVGRAHRTERDFVANVSHDLRTPLTSIQGFSQAMLDGTLHEGDGYRQAAEIINSEAKRMSRLVGELSSLSALEDQLASLELRPVDLATLLDDLVRAMQPQAREAGITLSFHSATPATLMLGNADRLTQAFSNLVDNSLKFTPRGGTVDVSVRSGDDGLHVTVSDSGAGIPEDDLPRVTERFYQVDKSRREGNSAGLGLAIAREIVRTHGGELRIESTLGHGTTVEVSLPVAGPGTAMRGERGGIRANGASAGEERRSLPPASR